MQWAQNQEPVNSDQEIDLLAGFSNIRKYLRDRKNLSLKNVCSGYVMGTEKTIIKKALERTNWNRKKAAGLLDISYKSLLNKIKKYRWRELLIGHSEWLIELIKGEKLIELIRLIG